MLSNIPGNYTVSFVEKYLAENAKGKWQWIRDAFAKLDDESKSNVIKQMNLIIIATGKHKIGIMGALEVLARLGAWMVQHGVRTRS
ncbi:MAG: hypothetical protein QXS54_00265 [Candidatus Methanomethylicaceae archaeon]